MATIVNGCKIGDDLTDIDWSKFEAETPTPEDIGYVSQDIEGRFKDIIAMSGKAYAKVLDPTTAEHEYESLKADVMSLCEHTFSYEEIIEEWALVSITARIRDLYATVLRDIDHIGPAFSSLKTRHLCLIKASEYSLFPLLLAKYATDLNLLRKGDTFKLPSLTAPVMEGVFRSEAFAPQQQKNRSGRTK